MDARVSIEAELVTELLRLSEEAEKKANAPHLQTAARLFREIERILLEKNLLAYRRACMEVERAIFGVAPNGILDHTKSLRAELLRTRRFLKPHVQEAGSEWWALEKILLLVHRSLAVDRPVSWREGEATYLDRLLGIACATR